MLTFLNGGKNPTENGAATIQHRCVTVLLAIILVGALVVIYQVAYAGVSCDQRGATNVLRVVDGYFDATEEYGKHSPEQLEKQRRHAAARVRDWLGECG